MQDCVIVNKIIIIPVQIIVPLIVVDYRAVVVPANLRAVVGLDTLVLKVQRFKRQPLERDVN